MDNEQEEEQTKKKGKNHKIIIIASIIILLIVGFFFYLIQKNNATGQVEKFKSAIEKNEYGYVSKVLSNNNDEISKTQAKYFIEYIKKPQNHKRFNKEIEQIEKNIKDNKQNNTDFGSLTDSKHSDIVTVKKNGKKLMFLDKITFKPHLYQAYVKEYDNVGVYNYNIGKDMKSVTDKQKLSSVGKFFVGRYTIDTEKTIKDSLINGKVNGQMFIDTDERNSKGKIIVDDTFHQAWFKTTISNAQELENNKIKLHINNKETEFKPNKIYGKYAVNSDLSVYATGVYEDKKFKTKPIKVERNHNHDIQQLELAFSKSEIDEYKVETEKLKTKSKDFMNKYVSDLNKAYDKHDYSKVDKYIKPNSKLEKQLLKLMKSKEKVKYNNLKFVDVSRENNKIKIIMDKQLKGKKVKSEYILKQKHFKGDFEIIKYKDL